MVYFRHDGFCYSSARCIRFQTATTPTRTDTPTCLDRHMSDFTGSPCQARIQTTILYNATADACAYEHDNKGRIASTRTIEVFSQGSHFDIIANRDGLPKLLAEYLSHRHSFDSQIWCINHNPIF